MASIPQLVLGWPAEFGRAKVSPFGRHVDDLEILKKYLPMAYILVLFFFKDVVTTNSK